MLCLPSSGLPRRATAIAATAIAATAIAATAIAATAIAATAIAAIATAAMEQGVSNRRNRRRVAGVVILLALHGALAVHSLWNKSTTYDEVVHLPAALAMVATGEDRLNPEQPPLVKVLAGLAASTHRPRLPLDGEAFRARRPWDFGGEVLYRSGNDAMALLRYGRLPVVALSMIGGLVVFLWGRRRFGDSAGFFSLALYTFSPTVLAHARLVTMDIAVSTGVVSTLYLWWRATASEEPSWGRDLATGAALGLALAAKFSGLILLPAMALTELIRGGWRSDLRRRLVRWGIVLSVAALVVQLAYLRPEGVPRYAGDMAQIYTHHNPEYPQYLAGSFSREGWRHYFALAMAVKSALPGLAAMFVGLGLAVWHRRRWRDDIYLWFPAALWFVVVSLTAVNRGVRYVLPVYALLLVLAGGPVARWLSRWRPLGGLLVALLVVAQASEAVKTHPDYLPYFNQLAGGMRGGPRWLDGSNLDWGQDLFRLPGWLEERGIERVRLLYFGTGEPDYFGVPREPLPVDDWAISPRPGVYVVSANYLVRGLLEARDRGWRSDWLNRYQPVDILGGTLYLYVFDADSPGVLARP